MNVRVLFLLLVYKAMECDKIAESQTLIVPKIDEKCKNIKCSTQEDPTCVKVKHLKDIKKVFYVIALHKCELQFMKCHKDYQAIIVPMKMCGHIKIMKRWRSNYSTVVRRGRVKRHIVHGVPLKEKGLNTDYSSYEGNTGFRVNAEDIYDDKHIRALKNRDKLKLNIKDHKEDSASDRGGFDIRLDYSYDDKEDWDLFKKTTVEAGFEVHADDIYYDNQGPKLEGKLAVLDDRKKQKMKLQLNAKDNEIEKLSAAPPPHEEIDQDVVNLFSQETIAERKKQTAESIPENNDECPDSCPAHTQMICAKCPHGVYKTFLSTCHLRQYCCKNEEETLEVVSRYPCILSAPFIDDAGVKSSGIVENQHNNDIVLDYIKCKSLNILGKSDPRCPFRR